METKGVGLAWVETIGANVLYDSPRLADVDFSPLEKLLVLAAG